MAQSATTPRAKSGRSIKFLYEIFFCAFSLLNVLFVLFDITYLMGVPYTDITFRDVYLQKLPPVLDRIGVRPEYRTIVTDTYDPVKDIIPHRSTDRYLTVVDLLDRLKSEDQGRLTAYLEGMRNEPGGDLDDFENDLRNDRRKTVARVIGDGTLPGLNNEQEAMGAIQERPAQIAEILLNNAGAVERKILNNLRVRSVELIDESPFDIARKNGTLEVLKRTIRAHVKNRLETDQAELARIGGSAKKSFDYFWRLDGGPGKGNLTPANYAAQLAWFNAEIRPLMEQNYFRHIGDDGELYDAFYRIDVFFVAVFALDFLVRWILAVFYGTYRKWYLFPVTRWFEIFNLLLPHHTAWLRLGRVIPLYVRMRENGFLPGEGIVPSLVHDNAAVIAEEISGQVMLRILTQLRTILQTADMGAISGKSDTALAEIQALLDSQTEVLAHGMVPAIQPGVADLVQHSIDKAMEPWLLSPIGGVFRLALVSVHKSVRDGLAAALSDDEGRDQMAAILRRSTEAILAEMTTPDNLRELQKNLDSVLGSIREDLEASLKKQNQNA